MAKKSYSLSDLRFISPLNLRSWFATPTKFAVVDVRESDYVGGHIKGCLHYPAHSFHDTLPELRSKLLEKQVTDVVFHCALSQVRGPKSALSFLRSLEELPASEKEKFSNLNVWVLQGGFTNWQSSYGDDKELTEGYEADLWN